MIKSILGGKSKNLCDVAYLLTLPVDKNFERYGFWEVEISVEPDTVYTFSRENANQINVGGATYLGIINGRTMKILLVICNLKRARLLLNMFLTN